MNKGYWKIKKEDILIKDMSDKHIENAIRYLDRVVREIKGLVSQARDKSLQDQMIRDIKELRDKREEFIQELILRKDKEFDDIQKRVDTLLQL